MARPPKPKDQYPATDFAVRAMRILTDTPGLTATKFAAVAWPHRKNAGLLAAINLAPLARQGLIWPRFEPPFWKAGRVKPQKRYYLTDKGWQYHDYHSRKRQSEARNTPNSDGKSGPGDGAGVVRGEDADAGNTGHIPDAG